jgi:hypothetical protein
MLESRECLGFRDFSLAFVAEGRRRGLAMLFFLRGEWTRLRVS